MQNTTLKFGLYSSAFLIGMNMIALALWGTDPENYKLSEIFGYTAIVLSLVFVFLGIREYKKEFEDVGFLKALKIGSIISSIPSLVFGIYNVIYVKWIDPDFFDQYLKYQIDQLENPTAHEIAELQASMESMSNPVAMFIIMFLTVFLIGFIVTIISSFILKK